MEEKEVNQAGNATAKQEQAAEQAQEAKQEKTFTQEELNAIIQQRLAREKEKSESELTAAFRTKEAELNQRELQLTLRERMAARGLPGELAGILKVTDEAEIENTIGILMKYTGKKEEKTEESMIGFTQIGAKPGPKENGPDPFRKVMGLK